MVCTAPTCGLTKGGRLRPAIDKKSGKPLKVHDPETGEEIDKVDDVLLEDMQALAAGKTTPTLRHIPRSEISLRSAVPIYYDRRYHETFLSAIQEAPAFRGFSSATLGELIDKGWIVHRAGHGSPSADVRVGTVPYIKVSDLRAGLVNINPTNRIPLEVARRRFWKAKESGIRAWDLISPQRTSKNIGDFCVLLPGQEQVVITKEVRIFRTTPKAPFDQFYLLWALSLSIVRDQWRRVVFMQTNREDVGERFLEIRIPVPPSEERALEVSDAFRSYYKSLGESRQRLGEYLADHPDHHFFIGDASGAAMADDEIPADSVTDVLGAADEEDPDA